MPDLDDLLQLTANGVVNGSAYAVLAVSFALILGVAQRFHFAFGFVYAAAAYAAAQAGQSLGVPFGVAVVVGGLAAFVLGGLIEWGVYRPVARRARGDALLPVFIASLGVAIAGENAIRLIWIDAPSQQILGAPLDAIALGSVTVTRLNVELVATCWLMLLAVALVLARTRVGRVMRAVRTNPRLCETFGIDPVLVRIGVFAVASALTGVVAVFAGAQTAVTPDIGFRATLFAFMAAFLAGMDRSPLVIGAVGLLLGLAESWTGLWLSAQWSMPIVFGLIFLYVGLLQLRAHSSLARVRVARVQEG